MLVIDSLEKPDVLIREELESVGNGETDTIKRTLSIVLTICEQRNNATEIVE